MNGIRVHDNWPLTNSIDGGDLVRGQLIRFVEYSLLNRSIFKIKFLSTTYNRKRKIKRVYVKWEAKHNA